MPSKPKVIAYLAVSADGFIARPDGGIDWLDRPWPKGAYGMPAFMRSIATVVQGRRTYDIGRRHGSGLWVDKRNVIVSRSLGRNAVAGAEIVHGSMSALARRLRKESKGNIWLLGGSEIFRAFLDAGELDELILHVIPVLIGTGLPLLSPLKRRTTELRLRSSRRFADGVVRLHYSAAVQ